MKFAEISVVRLNNDVITTSNTFDAVGCGNAECYDSAIPGDPCWDE